MNLNRIGNVAADWSKVYCAVRQTGLDPTDEFIVVLLADLPHLNPDDGKIEARGETASAAWEAIHNDKRFLILGQEQNYALDKARICYVTFSRKDKKGMVVFDLGNNRIAKFTIDELSALDLLNQFPTLTANKGTAQVHRPVR